MERTLAPRDHALVLQLVPAEHDVDAGAYERLARSGRVDGFLLTDVEHGDRRLDVLDALDVPTVVAGRAGDDQRFACVETQHGRGMGLVARHLAALGHRRVAFVGGRETLDYVRVRLRHWREALAAAGLDARAVIHAAPHEPVAAAAARALATGATAVACTSDVLEVAVVAAARAHGRRMPEDLAVTGFDDSALAALASPPLTSVRVDYAEFGAAAAAALLAVVDGEDASPRCRARA